MNLLKMIEMQKVLDEKIIKKHNLEGQNLVPNTVLSTIVELCETANEWQGFKHWKVNPEPKPNLLNEYVDVVHFFLSLAIQKGWEDLLFIFDDAVVDLRQEGFEGGLTGAFTEVIYWLTKITIEREEEKHFRSYSKHEFCFKNAWFIFVCIGLIGFGFTSEQIEQAYMAKNAENLRRQEEGY